MKPATLTPPNRSALWSRLALTKAQLAELCGVTTRQVSHWTLKGSIGTSSHHPDRYSGEAIDLCTLVKQGLDQGLPLRRAVGQARAFLSADREHRPVVGGIEPMALADIHVRLQGAQEALTTVLQVVEPLVPRLPEDGHAEELGG
jgi:hypothetical protein